MRHIKFRACALIAISLLTLPWMALSKDIYVAQTASGAGDGSSAANATSASWYNSPGNWGAGAQQIGAGDTVHLVGTFNGQIITQGSGSPGNPITLLFEPGANFTMSGGSAINLGNNNYLVVDGGQNGFIRNTNNGTALGQQNPVTGITGSPSVGYVTVQNVTMSNLFIHTLVGSADVEYGAGVYLAGNLVNIDVHGCKISDIQHGILFGYLPGQSSNWNVYSNTLNNCSWGIGVGSGNTGAMLSGIKISYNNISGQSVWDAADNYYHENGIYLYAESTGASISNIIVNGNVVGPDDGNHATATIFMSSAAGAGIWNAAVFNNVLFAKNVYVNAGMINFGFVNNGQIFNNTIDCGNWGSGGISLTACSNVYFMNNIYADGQQAIRTVNTSGVLFLTQIAMTDFNDYYNMTGGSVGWGANGGGSLVNWRKFNFDLNSQVFNPKFANYAGNDFHPLSANNVGTNLTAWAIPGLTTDRDGNSRPPTGKWDAGAYQYTAGTQGTSGVSTNNTPPTPPTNVRIIGR